MQTREILALHSGAKSDWGDGPLGQVADQLLSAFQKKEASRLERAEVAAQLAGTGPALAVLERKFAEIAAQELFDIAMPMATRFDFLEVLRGASQTTPSDRGLKIAAKHAEEIWSRDPYGVVAVGDVARFRAHYTREYPNSQVAATLDTDLPKVGFNTLPVQKLAQMATIIRGASQEELEQSYSTVIEMNGLTSNKQEHIRARAYLRGLANLAEEFTTTVTAAEEGGDAAVERTLQRMATGDDAILRSVTGAEMPLDMAAKDELELYIENTAELYNQKKSIIENILRKMKSGRYDPMLAPKLWMYWVDAGARSYLKEFGGPGDSLQMMFPRPLRMALAEELARDYEERIRHGEYGSIEGRQAQLDMAPPDMAPSDMTPSIEETVPHEETTESIVEVDSPITGEPLALELGVAEGAGEDEIAPDEVIPDEVTPDEIEGLSHFGQLDDFVQMDEGPGETTTTIEDPSAPGEFIDVTLAPAGTDDEIDAAGLLPSAPMDAPLAASAGRHRAFAVFAIRGGVRGKKPIDRVEAESMPRALAIIAKRLAEIGSSSYEVRAPADAFKHHALIVLDADAGNHLYVVAEEKGTEFEPDINTQQPDQVKVPDDGAAALASDGGFAQPRSKMKVDVSTGASSVEREARAMTPAEVRTVSAAHGLDASSIEAKLLQDEPVHFGDWAILVNASGDVELQKAGRRVITKSIVEMDNVIATFMARTAAEKALPLTTKTAHYNLQQLMLVGCAQCGGLDEYLMPERALNVKCARCGTETPARVVAAQLESRNIVPGYVLVTDVPGEDVMNARRLLMAVREVSPTADGAVRNDGKLEISLRAIDERTLARIQNVLESKFGVTHQIARTAQAAPSTTMPESQPTMGVQIAPQQQQSQQAPTYTPPTPAATPPIGMAQPIAPTVQQAPAVPKKQVGPTPPPAMPAISVQMPTQPQQQTTQATRASRFAWKVTFKGTDGRPRAMPVEARDEATARHVFASYNGDAEILSVTAQELPPDMMDAEPTPSSASPIPAAPGMDMSAPTAPMSAMAVSPEVKEAIAAAMLTYRNSGVDVATAVKDFQSQFRQLVSRFGDETSPARQALGAEIIRAAQETWAKPALLELAAMRQAGAWDIDADDIVDFIMNVEPLYRAFIAAVSRRQYEEIAEEAIQAYQQQSPGHSVIAEPSEVAQLLMVEASANGNGTDASRQAQVDDNGYEDEAEIHSGEKLRIELDNQGSEPGSVLVTTDDAEGAMHDQSIRGSMWENADGMAYAIISDEPGLVEALEADGYDVYSSAYSPMDELMDEHEGARHEAADGKTLGKMPTPGAVPVQHGNKVQVPTDASKVLGPDSSTAESANRALDPPGKVKTQHPSQGSFSKTDMGGGEEDKEPRFPGEKKPPANGSYGLVGDGTSLTPTDLGEDSQTGDNPTTKKWDSESKKAPKNMRSK